MLLEQQPRKDYGQHLLHLSQGKSANWTGWSVIKIAIEAGTTKCMATGCGYRFIEQPKQKSKRRFCCEKSYYSTLKLDELIVTY